MAIHACHAPGFVRATLPEQVRTPRMAFFTDGVLLGDGVGRIFAEADRNCLFATPGFHMSAPRSMAGFTPSGFHGSSWMLHDFAHDGVLEATLLILVTGHACFASHVISVPAARRRICFLWCACRFPQLLIRLALGGNGRQYQI